MRPASGMSIGLTIYREGTERYRADSTPAQQAGDSRDIFAREFHHPVMSNRVFIATSIDGYIADRDGGLGWLDLAGLPPGEDGGFARFIGSVDAIVMGRVTFEAVVRFGRGWPYPVPGIVLSSTVPSPPTDFASHVEFASGIPREIVKRAGESGFDHLYIDGGRTIQEFLRADLIDEMIITEIPILLGGGTRLFGELNEQREFDLIESHLIAERVLQRRYRRMR